MNTKIIAIALAFACAGCAEDPEGTAQSSNGNVNVSKLTTVDDCVIYRFFDAGHYHYFAKCKSASAIISTQSNGKSSRSENIPTEYE